MQKVLDALTELIDRIRKILGAKEAQLTPEQTEGFRDLQGKAEEMAKLLGDALKATEQHAVNEKNTATEGGVRKSIMVTPDGKKYVKADRQVIFGNDPDEWSEQLENYINGKIRRG